MTDQDRIAMLERIVKTLQSQVECLGRLIQPLDHGADFYMSGLVGFDESGYNSHGEQETDDDDSVDYSDPNAYTWSYSNDW